MCIILCIPGTGTDLGTGAYSGSGTTRALHLFAVLPPYQTGAPASACPAYVMLTQMPDTLSAFLYKTQHSIQCFSSYMNASASPYPALLLQYNTLHSHLPDASDDADSASHRSVTLPRHTLPPYGRLTWWQWLG
jgi:hypothetical protein